MTSTDQSGASASPKKKRRPRRSSEEVWRLILEAATDSFTSKGYQATTTGDIARAAGVAEPLIFKHFGSKANLFNCVVFKPLEDHFERFTSTHKAVNGTPEEKMLFREAYTLDLIDFIAEHADTFRSLLAAQLYYSEGVRGLGNLEGLQNYIARTIDTAKSHTGGRKDIIDPHLMLRISFSAILASVLFKDWLFPKGLASDKEIKAAIAEFIKGGVFTKTLQLDGL